MHEMMNFTPWLLFGISDKGRYKLHIRFENGMYEVRKAHYVGQVQEGYGQEHDIWGEDYVHVIVSGRATKLDTAILICEAESKNFVGAYWWSPGDEISFESWTCKCHRINLFRIGEESPKCDNCGRQEIDGRVGERASTRQDLARAKSPIQ